MTKKISLSIIFPAYNEEKNILISIDRAEHYAKSRGFDYEIIVVDDGSRDQTGSFVSQESKQNNKIKLLRHKRNQGYGATVYDGLKAAKKDLVFFTDSDLQFDINELDKFISEIKRYDFVIGYRNPRRDHFMRLVNAWCWNKLINWIFSIRIKDVDCAFKLFKKTDLDKIRIQSKGAMFSAELLIRLMAKNKKMIELPVSHYKRVVGSTTGAKPAVIARAFKELAKIRPELKKELAQIDG